MPEAISSDLTSALAAFASRETILIALDFDGTLAPLVDDPEDSRMIAPARAGAGEADRPVGSERGHRDRPRD
jgi:hypothetical protein